MDKGPWSSPTVSLLLKEIEYHPSTLAISIWQAKNSYNDFVSFRYLVDRQQSDFCYFSFVTTCLYLYKVMKSIWLIIPIRRIKGRGSANGLMHP